MTRWKPGRQSTTRYLLSLCGLPGLAFAAGPVADWLLVPLAWMIGPMVASVSITLMLYRKAPPIILRTVGKLVMGGALGLRDVATLAGFQLMRIMLSLLWVGIIDRMLSRYRFFSRLTGTAWVIRQVAQKSTPCAVGKRVWHTPKKFLNELPKNINCKI